MSLSLEERPLAQPSAAGDGGDVADRLDRLPVTALHVGILALCTFGLASDIAEVALSNTFSALFLAPPYSVPRATVSMLLAAVFVGGAIGAPAFGWLGDRAGRRTALQGALAVLVCGSVAAAFSPNVGVLTAFRFVSGLALGAYPPLTAAFLSDVLPPARRGVLMMLCAAFSFLGAPAIIFLIRWLTPLAPLGIEGWRWSLIAGAVVAAATAVLFFLVPESPRWLAALRRTASAEQACGRFERAAKREVSLGAQPQRRRVIAPQGGGKSGFAALRGPRLIRRTVLLSVLYALAPWAGIGFPLLSAAVLMQKGFRIGDSLLFAAASMFGPTFGIGAVATAVDRIERRVVLTLCAAAMAAIGILFAAATGLTALTALGAAFNLLSAVYSVVLSIYAVELFPTPLRASATALAWGIGRAVSVLVPILLLPLLGTYGPLPMFAAIAAALTASILVILIAGPPGLALRPVE